jgi:tRNA pseudouridine55 synthase
MKPRRRKGAVIDGWIIVDKPSGPTSTTVVAIVRRALDAQKAGHGGTLDPLATGILPVAIGQATKTVPYVQDATKEYTFSLSFGEARDTDDAEGAVIETSAARPTDEAIRAALEKFTGDIMQVPPIFSAIKVAGERAYDLSRAGAPPVLEARPARVDRFVLLDRPDADTAVLGVASGKGVYMRSLARDLARAIGTVGYISALRRTRVGPFTEAMAVALDKFQPSVDNPPASEFLLPVETALADIPALALTGAESRPLLDGQAISLVPFIGRIPAAASPDNGLVRVTRDGRAIALARLCDGMLQPERLLVPELAQAGP